MSTCKKCGNTDPPESTCSACGGHGLVHDYGGDATACRYCGGSGVQYPPICPACSAFRSSVWAYGKAQR